MYVCMFSNCIYEYFFLRKIKAINIESMVKYIPFFLFYIRQINKVLYFFVKIIVN